MRLSTIGPVNVRELKHVLERATIGCDGELITLPLMHTMLAEIRLPAPRSAAHSPFEPKEAAPVAAIEPWPVQAPARFDFDSATADWKTLDAVERDHICATLERVFYNQSAAARLLGISRQSLLRKLKAHRIELPSRDTWPR